jgi:hypothetical protein
MSGLTKKAVYADKVLSSVLGVSEGDFVSYAEISRGLHKYIKDNNLRTEKGKQIVPAPKQAVQPPIAQSSAPQSLAASTGMKSCRDCGAEIPLQAVFCDLCGIGQ